jgi:hypothetical protein
MPNLTALYQSDYFKVRSDRGYADYASEKIYQSVVSTLEKNLRDLNFFAWEKSLNGPKHAARSRLRSGPCRRLVSLQRGWHALGIDIAHEMIEAGKKCRAATRRG